MSGDRLSDGFTANSAEAFVFPQRTHPAVLFRSEDPFLHITAAFEGAHELFF